MRKKAVRTLIVILLVTLPATYFVGKRLRNTCPVCNQTSRFLPFGVNPRPRAVCGQCGSLERHRLLYLYLRSKTDFFSENLSVLHFSPNQGLAWRFHKLENLNYVTSEYEGEADLNLDLTQLDLPDGSFDVMLCLHVFEHIPADLKAMGEMYRVLKPGGWAVLQVPWRVSKVTYEDPKIVDPEEREKHFGRYDHVRIYGKDDFISRLKSVGFEVTVESIEDTLPAADLTEYATPTGPLVLVRKPPGCIGC